MFVPKGVVHGFIVSSKEAIFSYKVDNYHMSDFEEGLKYNDKKMNIDWNVDLKDIKLSKKR